MDQYEHLVLQKEQHSSKPVMQLRWPSRTAILSPYLLHCSCRTGFAVASNWPQGEAIYDRVNASSVEPDEPLVLHACGRVFQGNRV